jgi:hypothetical protein
MFLAVAVAGLGICAGSIYLKAHTFGHQFVFTPIIGTTNTVTDSGLVPDSLEAAKEKLKDPPVWAPTDLNPFKYSDRGSLFVPRPVLVANGAIARLDVAFYKDSLTGQPIPNRWLYEHGLSLTDPTITLQDTDKDGFPTEDEWRGKTDPNDASSHPPYYTKLFLDKFIQVPFPYMFSSEGDPKTEAIQLDSIDHRRPTVFIKLGDMVPETKFKFEKFAHKEAWNAATQDVKNVSEMTLVNVDTGKKVVLIFNQIANSPEAYARFVYEWPAPVQMIQVKEGEDFVLRPEADDGHRYQLIEVNETQARIRLPSGEIQVIQRDPRRGTGALR